MQYKVIQRILGLLLVLFSSTHIPPIIVSFIYADGAGMAFFNALWITFSLGAILWFPVRHTRQELRLRDGFLVVVMFWTVLGLFGALPLYIASAVNLSLTDAIFESISGLTTTGATVITGLDTLPKSILFYRQMLQWMGGMGIIVLAVAILPMLGVGGMQLYRAETPGPVKDSKLTPRINETAKALWYIYFSLTVACAAAYWLAGMSLFDAISHSFSTVAIGGFSPHDTSIGYFDSAAIEAVCIIFMTLGGVNFALHFSAVRNASFKSYYLDEECRAYLLVLLLTGLVCILALLVTGTEDDTTQALRKGLFHAVSIATTTGFATDSFYLWPPFIALLLIMASFIGGSAGSTGGGMKVIRFLLLLKQGMRELKRLVHPNAHLVIKMGGGALSEKVIEAVWGFFSAYVAVFIITMLFLIMTGMDQVTAFSAVAACLNNLGPGLGDVGAHYGDISNPAKWVLCFTMLLGRLEIFTLLVLLTPAFWKR